MSKSILNWVKSKVANRGLVLMYHQVAHLPCDPWQLAVTPENFETHLKILAENYEVVPLQDIALNLHAAHRRKRLVAITFDDGYLDNLLAAAPLLKKYNLPATFFIATRLIGTDDLFWWDELSHLILLRDKLPEKIELTIGDERLYLHVGESSELSKSDKLEIKNWISSRPFPNKRAEVFYKIWERLKLLSIDQRSQVLMELRQQINCLQLTPGVAQIMNVNQLKQLASESLFTIGAHTINHPALAVLTLKEQQDEIQEGKAQLENWLGRKVSSFAYPYGNYNANTLDIIRSSAFSLAVTTESKLVKRATNVFEMPRYQVVNLNEAQFSKQTSAWFSSISA